MTPTIMTCDKQGVRPMDIVSQQFQEKRKIFLNEAIDARVAMEMISQLEYLDNASHEDIYMYINSPGGCVSDGLAIIDAMNRCKSDIVTVCTGCAASMASVITAYGTKGKRCITPLAEIMIHQPLGGISGQASDIARAAEHISGVKKKLTEMLAERTGQPIDQIAADCDRDSYLNATQAIAYGLVDKIYGE